MYSKKQRIAALCGIILLAGLYIFTLIAAIFDFDGTGSLLKACLAATVAIPILIWIYIWMYGVYTKKHTPASFDFLKDKDTKSQKTDQERDPNHDDGHKRQQT